MYGLAKSAELRLQGVGIHYRRLAEEDAEDRMDASRRRSAPDPSVCVLPQYIPKFVDVRGGIINFHVPRSSSYQRDIQGGMLPYWTAFCQPEIPATSVQHEHGGTGEVLICTLVYSNLIDKLGTCGGAVPSLPGFVPGTCITNMSSKVLQSHQTTCVATYST
jgi:hypothetical protein